MLIDEYVPPDFPSSKSFGILSLLTLALTYVKLTTIFYVRWRIILSPLIFFFIYKFINSVIRIGQVQNKIVPYSQAKMKTLWNISCLLITSTLAVALFYLGIMLEKAENNENIQEPLKHLFACFAFTTFVYLVYSYQVDDEKKQENQGVIMNFLLSLFGNSVQVCSGGACNSFYLSTLSAFFSAFGIPIAQYIHYLNYLCIILLAISLLSLYSVKQSIRYGPFLITFIGAGLIIFDMFVMDINMLNYIGLINLDLVEEKSELQMKIIFFLINNLINKKIILVYLIQLHDLVNLAILEQNNQYFRSQENQKNLPKDLPSHQNLGNLVLEGSQHVTIRHFKASERQSFNNQGHHSCLQQGGANKQEDKEIDVVDLIFKHAKPEERLCNIQPLDQQQDDIISILKSKNDLIVSQLGSNQIVQQYLKKIQKGEYDNPRAQTEPKHIDLESFQRIKLQLQLLLKQNAQNNDVEYL
ncbi:hypothetical protein pb186bvf_003218 [Paramecium bursaria]